MFVSIYLYLFSGRITGSCTDTVCAAAIATSTDVVCGLDDDDDYYYYYYYYYYYSYYY